MHVLIRKGRSARPICYYLIVTVLALFTFATLEISCHLRHVLGAFIWYKGSGGAIADFEILSSWVNVMKLFCYDMQTGIADAFLVRKNTVRYTASVY